MNACIILAFYGETKEFQHLFFPGSLAELMQTRVEDYGCPILEVTPGGDMEIEGMAEGPQ